MDEHVDPMEAFGTKQSFLEHIQRLATHACPGFSSEARHAALAAGLKCEDWTSLLAKLDAKPSGLTSLFELDAFRARLADHGSAAPAAAILEDFDLDVSEALMGWLLANEGYIEGEAMDVAFKIMQRRDDQRTARVLRQIEMRGDEPAPAIDAWGGYPSSLHWSLSWLPTPGSADAGKPPAPATIALRLRADIPEQKRHQHRSFGWGASYPDHGLQVPARGLLHFLGGGWLKLCVVPFKGRPQGFDPDIRHAFGHRNADSLPFLAIDFDQEGIHFYDDVHRFSPGSETILAVESLLLLGDAIAEGILARPAAAASDVEAAASWQTARLQDGFRPLEREDGDFGRNGSAYEQATAAWTASRLGMDSETYEQAALWGTASHVLRSRGFQQDSRMTAYDGILAAGLGALPSWQDVQRMTREAFEADPLDGPGNGTLEGWRTKALGDFNISMWPHMYYTKWEDRRPMTLAEILEQELSFHRKQVDRIRSWSAELSQALADGRPLVRNWADT